MTGHYFFKCICKDGRVEYYDLVKTDQAEAERILVRNAGEHGFTRLENGKIVHSEPLASYELIDVKDPHNTISPQMWKSYGIELTSYEDMIIRQIQWCKNHFEECKEKHDWPETLTLEEYTQRLCDSVKELWGLDTPDSLARAKSRIEWEMKYSKHSMSKARYNARKRWAKQYSEMWNTWQLGKYDKWTFQEMLEACGYASYYNKNEELVVLPCFDDDMPEVDVNGYEIGDENEETAP